MRDWGEFLDQVFDLVGYRGSREECDAAAFLLLDKEELDCVLYMRRVAPNANWDLIDYAITYFDSNIPF